MSDAWPSVPLGEALTETRNAEPVSRERSYPNFGIYSFGRGAFAKSSIEGMQTSASTLYRAKAGQFVYSRLFAFEGAYAIVPDELDGAYVSNEFPLFDCDPRRLDPQFLRYWICREPTWTAIATSSTGMGSRRQRVQPPQLLKHTIPLPPLAEQRRIVARVEALAGMSDDAGAARSAVAAECDRMLDSLFARLASDAPRVRLADAAPLTRRPAVVDVTATYPSVSVRSFGRGTFHSGVLDGSEITWEKPHLVKAGDVLISNIKAWEGAIGVASPSDDGRYGSHRYLTYVPVPGVATPRWVCHYLLSRDGLALVGEASPGSADRNRTTSTKALADIAVPLPSFNAQRQFHAVYEKVARVRAMQFEATTLADALLPSILDRAFKGAGCDVPGRGGRLRRVRPVRARPSFRSEPPPARTELPWFRSELPVCRAELPEFRSALPPFRAELAWFRSELPRFRAARAHFRARMRRSDACERHSRGKTRRSRG